MDAPQIGQKVRLNRPRSLDHGHVFEVIAVSGKFAEIKKPGERHWKTYTEPVDNLMSPEWYP
jgi:hypothetical protein